MTSSTATPVAIRSSYRPLRVAVDVVLRAAGIVALAELLSSLSAQSDALAGGLEMFFVLMVLAFATALLDGIFQRDRVRLIAVWALMGPVVAVVELALDVRRTMSEPGGYPDLATALAAARVEALSSFVLFALLIAVPAAVGVGLGVLLRPLTPAGLAQVRP